jgi:hypothetical protein
MPVHGSTQHASRSRLACAAAGLAGLGLAALPAIAPAATAAARPVPMVERQASAAVPALPASAQFVGKPGIARAVAGYAQACSTPTRPGQMACMALVPVRGRSARPDTSGAGGYTPADLQDAYGLTSAASKAGDGETVAVVDAYNDPHASSDLATYRSKFGLPACTTGTGCLAILNEYGGSSLPKSDPSGGWELEESLDLDMVSAICPNCHILLVEANSAAIYDLANAERTASRAPAVNAVTNSWGSGAEFIGENAYDPDFYAPGIAITAAGGDDGYGTQYPAASPYVTSVGGTTLVGTDGGTWTQSAWSLVGSGCSMLEPKPSWQTRDDRSPGGCLNRTQNDVSADADPATGVAVYDTVKYGHGSGVPDWTTAGGTSVSTPIIAATYALADIMAGGPGQALIAGTFPAAYPYQATSGLTDVVGGSNGNCEAYRQYLCHAVTGFDGPTGLGLPSGTAAFTGPRGGEVSIVDPGPQVVSAGAAIYLVLDTLPGTETPTFSLAPAHVGSLIIDKSGIMRGNAPSAAGSYSITVTATVGGVGTARTAFSIVVLPKLKVTHPGRGEVRLNGAGHCLTDAGDSARAGTAVRIGRCTGQADQRWEFGPAGGFAAEGLMKIHGKCLAIAHGSGNGARATIGNCTASPEDQWTYQGSGHLKNAAAGRCLAIHGRPTAGKQAVVWSCTGGADTGWVLPGAPVLSAVPGLCLADPGAARASGTRIAVAGCSGSSGQRWIANRNGTLEIAGKCLAVHAGSMLTGAAAELDKCTGRTAQQWQRGPDGQLMNANSGRCLADPGNSKVRGTKLIQSDCYGMPGEIWVIS